MAKTKRAKAVEIEAGSGNVFEDLGLPDASTRLAKAELARVMRGKLARFSQERLERFLNSLDMDVRIRVGPRAAGKKQANVTVELVAAF